MHVLPPSGRRAGPSLAPVAAALALVGALAACGGDDGGTARGWAGTVDTSATGTVVVRNPAEGVWDSASAWRVREELRIGSVDEEGPAMFGDVADLAVDAAGRIYVLESQAQEVRVFGPDGAFVRTIGRRGGGPGEFEGASAIRMAPGDTTFWVVDLRKSHYAHFDTAGRALGTLRRPFTFFRIPWSGGVDPATGALMEENIVRGQDFRSSRDVVYRLDAAGAVTDTVELPMFESEGFLLLNEAGLPMMRVTAPFAPYLLRHVDPRGYVWSAMSDRYRIVQRAFDGDTVRVIERAVEPRPVPSAAIDSAFMGLDTSEFARRGGKVDRAKFGRTYPLIGALQVDDAGHLWVRSSASPNAGPGFDVFDPEGRYLGHAPMDFAINGWVPPLVRGDRLYAVVRDSLDVPHVVRARIEGRE